MITKQQALQLRYGQTLWHINATNRDGTPARVRVTGKVKTWKTRPEEFRIPVKYGLRDSFYITQSDASLWTIGE